MASFEPKMVRDGMLSALAGVDSGRAPLLIDANQISWGVNIICRGGYIATRPRYTKRSLTFPHTEMLSWFSEQRMQGASIYYSDVGAFIIASVGGRLFRIDVDDSYRVSEITTTFQTATAANFNAPGVGAQVNITMDDASKIPIDYPFLVNGAVYVAKSKVGNVVTATNLTDTPAALVTAPALVIFLDPNKPNESLVWMEQAEHYLIVQNGKDGPSIYDGAYSRRPATNEVPTGTAMVYNEEIGRLCIALPDNQIVIGDVVQTTDKSTVLKFTETGYLAGGGRFRVPTKYGKVTALKMLANLDRSNGQGPMVASAERGFSTFNLPPNRDLWQNLTYPPQVNMPIQFSAASQASVVQVNGDLFYRAKDGMRSYIYAIREFSGYGHVPLSSEMDRILDKDDDRLLYKSCAMLFDNRLLFSVSPYTAMNGGIAHRAIGVLDFNTVSRMGTKAAPAYNGIWTGIRPTAMVSGVFKGAQRAFIFAVDADDGDNGLWEVQKETGDDCDDEGNSSRIQCAIETQSFDCDSPLNIKEAQTLEVWADQMFGEINLTAKYRPDSYPCWFTWDTATRCVAKENCDEEACKAVENRQPGYGTRIGFAQPPDSDETLDKKKARLGYEHQVRLEWTGQMRLRKLLFKAQTKDEGVYNVDKPAQSCDDTESVCCLPDDFGYVSGV